jgi:hypothetical protein
VPDASGDGGAGLTCGAGTHACGEVCYADGDPAHCGTGCVACTAPPPCHGATGATCAGGECSYPALDDLSACEGGVCCGGTCVAGASCCSNADCGSPGTCETQAGALCSTNGVCLYATAPDMTACAGGVCCGRACQAGANCCSNADCDSPGPCEVVTSGTFCSSNGVCLYGFAPDGTDCPGGQCCGGTCRAGGGC